VRLCREHRVGGGLRYLGDDHRYARRQLESQLLWLEEILEELR
jgi:hypothetical protein